MTAARVLNPVVLTEFCKIRATPAVGRNISCGGQQLNRIKRDLFGPVNPVETNKIFVEELDKHQEKAIKKWGFDFRAGTPLNANSQYVWERVKFPEVAYTPEMYTLTCAAHIRPTKHNNARAQDPSAYDILLDERAERENYTSILSSSSLSSTDTDDSCDDSQDESDSTTVGSGGHSSCSSNSSTMTLFKVPATIFGASKTIQLRKRQPKITEYMKERKRLAQTPKKLSPAKRLRTSPPGSNSSTHAQTQSQQQNSISSIAAYSIRKIQRNN